MKANCLPLFVVFSIAALISSPASAQIPRTYTHVCGLKDGSKFLLTVPYKYYPLSRGHANTHLVEGDWAVYYIGQGRGKSKAPARVAFNDAKLVDCSEVGKIDGIAIANRTYLKPNGEWFSRALIPDKLALSPTLSEQPAHLRKRLDEIHASPVFNFALVVPRNGRLVYEIALVSFEDNSPDGKVVAVYKSISLDNGRTWTDPSITTDAEIYELGKSEKAQSFAAYSLKK